MKKIARWRHKSKISKTTVKTIIFPLSLCLWRCLCCQKNQSPVVGWAGVLCACCASIPQASFPLIARDGAGAATIPHCMPTVPYCRLDGQFWLPSCKLGLRNQISCTTLRAIGEQWSSGRAGLPWMLITRPRAFGMLDAGTLWKSMVRGNTRSRSNYLSLQNKKSFFL